MHYETRKRVRGILRLWCCAAWLVAGGVSSAQADDVSIVGSSTVYPFLQATASILAERGEITPPRFRVTGTGEGLRILCQAEGEDSPDISGASRRMKASELEQCTSNGIEVVEVPFGLDAIIVAQQAGTEALNLTRRQLFLALAARVPAADGHGLIDNPYRFWNQIDAQLPHRPIVIWGPPRGSGTRDTLEHLLLDEVSQEMPAYSDAGLNSYHRIREDGVFIDDHEDHERTIRELLRNGDAVGIFGYSYYFEHHDALQALPLDGVNPDELEAVSQLQYPLSRLLFVYAKRMRMQNKADVDALVRAIMSDEFSGADGLLVRHGLIPLQASILNATRLMIRYYPALTAAALLRKFR